MWGPHSLWLISFWYILWNITRLPEAKKKLWKRGKKKKRTKEPFVCLWKKKIVCFLLEQIPALNHSFGCISQNCPSSFFIFFYLVFLQKWGKNLAIVLSKSHRENQMRLSDALMRGWRLKKYKVTWSCTSSANNRGLKPINLKSRPKLPNLWQ